MTYEELRVSIISKLGEGVDRNPEYISWSFTSASRNSRVHLYLNNRESVYYEEEGLVSLRLTEPFNIFDNIVIASNYLENFFKDPSNATLEEVALFKLEYGFDYPEELTNDL